MLEEERKSLYSRKDDYLSIGISCDGEFINPISVPWEKTAHAFNMKITDVYITLEDLSDKELVDKIKSFHVVRCYVFATLDDYSFIAGLKEVRDIYIANGAGLVDLSFLSELGEWRMLHVARAHLKDLDPVLESSKIDRMFPAFCLSFADCTVDDVTALYEMKHISELIIIGEDDNDERAKWKRVSALTHRYYKIER